VVSHISRKTSEMPRISCTQLWTGPRVRLSLRRDAGSSGSPRNFTGNRRCGAPGILCGDCLLGGGASDYLDEVVQAEMAGEGFLDLICAEFVVLLRRYDGLIQGEADDGPAQQTLGYSLFA
jgi:hypothetical protein